MRNIKNNNQRHLLILIIKKIMNKIKSIKAEAKVYVMIMKKISNILKFLKN
jgi:hypothetical protein